MATSLRARLLAWVVLPLAAAVVIDGWITYANARDAAAVVQDRLLLGSARIVAEQLRFEDGAFQHHIPPAALELFESSQVDRIYYRVTTGSGQLLAGYDDLEAPAAPLQLESPHFFDTAVRDEPTRAVAFLQPVIGVPDGRPVMVEIGQTMNGHTQMTRGLWAHSIGQQLFILVLAAALIALGLRKGLQPLIRLRDLVLSRQAGTLQPLEIDAVPSELTPLVAAINDYIRRLEEHAGAQRIFVQNAAHQLRTPFALLNTQVAYASRVTDLIGKDESLAAIRHTLQQAVRLLNQLLTLSAAEAQGGTDHSATLNRLEDVVRRVLEDLSAHAQSKAIDLGYEQSGSAPVVVGNPMAVREIISNLVDNAIRYTQPGGIVTVHVRTLGDEIELSVEDDGPGIAPAYRERVFERFYRLEATNSDGCGLGLPIVREFAARLNAHVWLSTPGKGVGLEAKVRFTVRKGTVTGETKTVALEEHG